MGRQNYEQTTYISLVDQVEVVIHYKNNILNIYVAPEHTGQETYYIKLTSNTRKLPEFKRFNNDIRARIGTGIYVCSRTPGFNLPIYLAQESDPSPWYTQRRKVNPT